MAHNLFTDDGHTSAWLLAGAVTIASLFTEAQVLGRDIAPPLVDPRTPNPLPTDRYACRRAPCHILGDARFAVAGMWPLSDHWVFGATVAYLRLLGDAADSPITKDRGDANQIIDSVGSGYTWQAIDKGRSSNAYCYQDTHRDARLPDHNAHWRSEREGDQLPEWNMRQSEPERDRR